MLSRRKGITPIIATIVLLLITMSLLGGAWVFISGITATTRSCVQIPPGLAPVCSSGQIKVYVYNCGTESIQASSLDSIEVNGIDVTGQVTGTGIIGQGKTGALFQGYTCGCFGCAGKKTIRLIKGSITVSADVDCGEVADTCSCEGTGYSTRTCSGQTIYMDCNADKCWTPYMANVQWSTGDFSIGHDCQLASCAGGGAACPACNYCDTLSYGGFGAGKWKLPDQAALQSLCFSGACSPATGLCFGDTEMPSDSAGRYWTDLNQNANNAIGVSFSTSTFCQAGPIMKSYPIIGVRCVLDQTIY